MKLFEGNTRKLTSNSAFTLIIISIHYQGLIQGPEEFAEGLAYGVKSLVGGTVGKIKILQCAFFLKNWINITVY